ncbi:unnamed protein product, partial [Phytomonas sp. Hart1]
MNELHARRRAQAMMFHQLMRSHGTLWAATQLTREPLDLGFVKEEFMRVNGRRCGPLLTRAAAEKGGLGESHFTHLTEHAAWGESFRAYAVQQQTPMTKHIAAMGRMGETIAQARSATTAQGLFLEYMAAIDGISTFEQESTLDEEEFE